MRALGIAVAAVLAAIGSPAAADPVDDVRAGTQRAAHPYAAYVTDAAQRFGVPEAWIWAVMRVESNGDPRAVSSAGAMGLMQIMPATWAALRARYGLGNDPFDPRDNIMAGAAYLRAMHDRYGNVAAMLAAYNAGPGRYDDYLARGRPLPAVTVAYVAQIAPMIGGTTDSQLAASPPPPDSLAWRRAGLFVATTAAPSVQPSDPATTTPAPVDPLFVRSASAARPQ